MSYFSHYFSNLGYWAAGLVVAGVTAAFLYLVARWSWRWFAAGMVAISAVVFLLWLPRRYPPGRFLRTDLPPLFLDHFWTWVLIFLLGAVFSIVSLIRALRALRPPSPVGEAAGELPERFPEIDAAWEEIRLGLDQARLDLQDQRVILLLAPEAGWAEAVVQSAGLQLFAQAPAGPAPIRAHATADGVLLDGSGASAFGTSDGAGRARMEHLCRLLRAEQPDCPVVRGVVVLFPIGWAAQPESVTSAAALRDDLRAIERVLQVRPPVFALFPEMEAVPGFIEFIGRMPREFRDKRVGFAVPGTHAFGGELVHRGLTWMAGWLHSWVLNRLAEDPLDQAGNRRLVTLDLEFRRFRKRLRAIAEAAFSTPREAEPVLFRGCYFVASGSEPDARAFSAGLLRGPRGRVLADTAATRWTEAAVEDDRRYRRLALGVGLGGGALTLLAWAYILRVTESPLWWAGLVAVVIAWIAALTRLSLARPA